MFIGILGPGRLGRSLSVLLQRTGCDVCLTRHAQAMDPGVDGVLLTVPDSALRTVAHAWSGPLPILHCSGALPVDVLAPHNPSGSFHPLMTFPGADVALPDLRGVPAVVDGHDRAVALGTAIAERLGMRTVRVPGDRRLYHAAAVIAGNFGTVLLAHAARALTAAGVDESDAGEVLLPLALESLRNAASDPARSLTGPVARGDEATIASHTTALRDAGLHSTVDLYLQLTDATRELHRGKL